MSSTYFPKESEAISSKGSTLVHVCIIWVLLISSSSEEDSRLKYCFPKMYKVVTYKIKITLVGITKMRLLEEFLKQGTCLFYLYCFC